MQKYLNLTEHDRDLVVMRHDFEIWDHSKSEQPGMMTRKRIHHSSTLIASG